MTEHTHIPWHLGMKPGPAVYGPQGEQVVMMHNPLIDYQENLANAAHIVKCVNAHDELVAILDRLVGAANMVDRAHHVGLPPNPDNYAELYQSILNAQTLLAKMKGT